MPSQIYLILGMPSFFHTVAKIPYSYQEFEDLDLPAWIQNILSHSNEILHIVCKRLIVNGFYINILSELGCSYYRTEFALEVIFQDFDFYWREPFIKRICISSLESQNKLRHIKSWMVCWFWRKDESKPESKVIGNAKDLVPKLRLLASFGTKYIWFDERRLH